MKKKINIERTKKIKAVGMGLFLSGVNFFTHPCFAKVAAAQDLTKVTNGLEVIKTLFLSVVAIIGIIILSKEALELSGSIKSQDSAGVISALKGMAGGAICISVSAVVAIFS